MRRFEMEPDPNASGRTPFSVACTAGEGRRCSRTAADNARGGREPLVAASHFEQFLDEATVPESDTDCPLGPDCLCGLRVSWCLLHGMEPRPDIVFRAAMHRCGIDIDDSCLRMIGPAAADYILASSPSGA
jgi:hypothetical protein